MRVRPGTRSSARTAGALAVGVLLAGCAAMPSKGFPPPSIASESNGGSTQAAQQVVVVAEPPKATDHPAQLLSNFLDDLVADESDYRTAKEYLGKDMNAAWNPEKQVTVLDGIQQRVLPGATSSRMTIDVSGHEMATLDAKHAYRAASGTLVHEAFEFTKGAHGWQIDSLPQGVILNQVDFQRIYESVNLYFPVAGQSDGSAPSPLAADPIYVRSHIDPLTDAADGLLDGPSDWLGPAVLPGFPTGTSLGGGNLDVTADGTVKVHFTGRAGSLLQDPTVCDRMAAQLFFTLMQVPTAQAKQAGQPINSVALYQGAGTSSVCTAGTNSSYSPLLSASADTSYFVDANGHLRSLDVGHEHGIPAPETVPGALAPPQAGKIGGFAVAPGGSGKVAVLSQDRHALYVSTLTQQTAPDHPVLTSSGAPGLTTPSWDSLGTLWTVDTNPASQGLRALVGETLVPVTVAGLQGTVTDVRVAADGARIALTVKNGDTSSVEVGRVQRSGTAAAPQLTIAGLLSVAPTLTTIKSVSWADGDSVIVLGQSAGTARGLSVWEIDGSSALVPGPQPLSPADASTVAALQQDSKAPLLVDNSGADPNDKGKIFRLLPGSSSWTLATSLGAPTGGMLSYPG